MNFCSRNCVCLIILLFSLGCSKGGTSRKDLSGSATFGGQPIVYGTIEFVPNSAAGHQGPAGSATILDGKYDTKLDGGLGVVFGPHHIRVTAYPQKLTVSEDETQTVEQPEPIFVEYTLESRIESATFDLVVPEEASGFGLGNATLKRANAP